MQRLNLYQQEHHPSPLENVWLEFKKSHMAVVGLSILIGFCLVAILAPLIAPYNPNLQNTEAVLLPPIWDANGTLKYILGTDSLGRDVFSRLLYGARTTFGVSLLIVLFSIVIGVGLGALAGLLSGIPSSVVNHLFDSILSIPTLLIAIIMVAILGLGLFNAAIAITMALIPQFIHQTRSFVKQELAKDYVLLDKLDGASLIQIFFRSIFPGMYELIVVQSTIALSIAIIDVSALGFLNIGAQSPTIELGQILSNSLESAYAAPWLIALPGIFIFLMVFSINLVGEGLRSALRNRLKQ